MAILIIPQHSGRIIVSKKILIKLVKMDKSIQAIYSVLGSIAQEHNLDTFEVFGVTNYVDARLVGLVTHLQKEGKVFTDQQRVQLADAVDGFVAALDPVTNTYFIPGSGTYGLKLPKQTLLQVAVTLRSQIQDSALTPLAKDV